MRNVKTKADSGKSEAKSESIFSLLAKKLECITPLFRKKFTYISHEVTIQGDIVAKQRLVIDGSMVGNIRSTEHVSLGPTANFKGSIECESASVSGCIEGRIQTRSLLLVQTPATIIGDLVSAMVQLESGVIFHGSIISNPGQVLPAPAIVTENLTEVSVESQQTSDSLVKAE